MKYGNTIFIHNNSYRLFGEPLNSFWSLIKNRPRLGSLSTSPLDIGYYADWLLKDNELYLLDFAGSDIFRRNQYEFEQFFGVKNIPFFAYWFCGEISVQAGEVVFTDYHCGDAKQYDFLMTFEKGKLISTEMQDNISPTGLFKVLSSTNLYSF